MKFLKALALLVVIFFIFKMCSGPDDKKEEAKEEVIHVYSDGSVAEVQLYLKHNLNDPESYEEIDWSPLKRFYGIPTHSYMVRHKYRAKNGFGALVVQNQIFYLDSLGNVVNVREWE